MTHSRHKFIIALVLACSAVLIASVLPKASIAKEIVKRGPAKVMDRSYLTEARNQDAWNDGKPGSGQVSPGVVSTHFDPLTVYPVILRKDMPAKIILPEWEEILTIDLRDQVSFGVKKDPNHPNVLYVWAGPIIGRDASLHVSGSFKTGRAISPTNHYNFILSSVPWDSPQKSDVQYFIHDMPPSMLSSLTSASAEAELNIAKASRQASLDGTLAAAPEAVERQPELTQPAPAVPGQKEEMVAQAQPSQATEGLATPAPGADGGMSLSELFGVDDPQEAPLTQNDSSEPLDLSERVTRPAVSSARQITPDEVRRRAEAANTIDGAQSEVDAHEIESNDSIIEPENKESNGDLFDLLAQQERTWSVYAGETVRSATFRLAKEAGKEVLWKTTNNYAIEVTQSFSGTYIEAISEFLSAYMTLEAPLYPGIDEDGNLCVFTPAGRHGDLTLSIKDQASLACGAVVRSDQGGEAQ